MAVRIIVDSTADLSETALSQVFIVPLTIIFGDTEYIDGVTIDHKTFYEKLIESDVLPTTSQASPAAFESLFDEIVSNGDSAIVLTISSKLSGTYQSAVIAASEYAQHIFVVDTESATIGAGILIDLALRLRDEGLDAYAIAQRLNIEKKKICLIAMLDTLEYLKKGGRISSAAAFAGTLLSIKPVICLEDGEIKILGKARGSRQGNNLLVQEIQKAGGADLSKPLLLGYTGLSDILLHKYIEDSKFLWDHQTLHLNYVPIGSVIGTHAGPGAIAVAFFKS